MVSMRGILKVGAALAATGLASFAVGWAGGYITGEQNGYDLAVDDRITCAEIDLQIRSEMHAAVTIFSAAMGADVTHQTKTTGDSLPFYIPLGTPVGVESMDRGEFQNGELTKNIARIFALTASDFDIAIAKAADNYDYAGCSMSVSGIFYRTAYPFMLELSQRAAREIVEHPDKHPDFEQEDRDALADALLHLDSLKGYSLRGLGL